MLFLILALYALIAAVLVWTYREVDNKSRNIVLSPFAQFCLFQISATWPVTLYLFHEDRMNDLYPAMVVMGGTVSYVVGYFVASKRKYMPDLYRKLSLQTDGPAVQAVGPLVISVVCFILLTFFLYQGVPPVLTLWINQGSMSTADAASFLAEQRFLATKSHLFGGTYRGQGLITEALNVGIQYVMIASIANYYATRRRAWLLAFVFILAMALLTLAGGGVRYRVFGVINSIVVFFSLARSVRISKKAIFILILLFAFLGISFQALTTWQGKEGGLAERMFLGEGKHNVDIIELIENGTLKYRYGQIHVQKFLDALPGVWSTDSVPFSNELAAAIGAEGQSTFASPTYLGVVYADFGIIGVLLGFFGLGFFTSLLTIAIFRFKKTVSVLPVIVLTISFMPNLASSGVIGYASSLLVIVCFHALYYACGAISKRLFWPNSAASRPEPAPLHSA